MVKDYDIMNYSAATVVAQTENIKISLDDLVKSNIN
jgi:hypothetical protein